VLQFGDFQRSFQKVFSGIKEKEKRKLGEAHIDDIDV